MLISRVCESSEYRQRVVLAYYVRIIHVQKNTALISSITLAHSDPHYTFFKCANEHRYHARLLVLGERF